MSCKIDPGRGRARLAWPMLVGAGALAGLSGCGTVERGLPARGGDDVVLALPAPKVPAEKQAENIRATLTKSGEARAESAATAKKLLSEAMEQAPAIQRALDTEAKEIAAVYPGQAAPAAPKIGRYRFGEPSCYAAGCFFEADYEDFITFREVNRALLSSFESPLARWNGSVFHTGVLPAKDPAFKTHALWMLLVPHTTTKAGHFVPKTDAPVVTAKAKTTQDKPYVPGKGK